MKTRVTLTPRCVAAGFTFLELMVVVSIMAVILTMGIPFFKHHQNMRNLDQGERELATVFKTARDFALSQGSVVVTITGTPVLQTSPSGLAVQDFVVQVTSNGNVIRNYNGCNGTFITLAPSVGGQILSAVNGVYTFNYASNGQIVAFNNSANFLGGPIATSLPTINMVLQVENTQSQFTLITPTGMAVEQQ